MRKCPKTLKNAKKSARQFYQNHRADLCCIVDNNRIGVSIPRAVQFCEQRCKKVRSGAKLHVAVQMVFLYVRITPRERKKKRNTAHIEIGVGGIFFLSIESRGENFDGDPRTEPESIHENFAFVYIRQLGVAIVELLKNLFLLVRKR